jgi:hypothetical protein
VNYNACDVKIHSATSSLVRFKNKDMFFYFDKDALACLNASAVVVNSEVVHRIGSWAQTYDFDLQRQHCKNLQRNK